jgi:AcrR family transcriptional regulator
MGRKAIQKNRKVDFRKKQEWAKTLFPFFQKHGVKGITIDEMAKWLGKSKSTLYEYFKSKNEILELSILSKIDDVIGFQVILQDENKTYRQRYNDFYELITVQIAGVSTKFLSELKEYFPDQWKVIEFFLQGLISSLKVYYKSGIKAGAFKNIHVALLIAEDQHFIFDLMTNPQFLEDNNLTVKVLVEQYSSLKLDGLGLK